MAYELRRLYRDLDDTNYAIRVTRTRDDISDSTRRQVLGDLRIERDLIRSEIAMIAGTLR